MIKYPAIIKYDPEDMMYNVEFPDLLGCLTFGDTLEEAKRMAVDALTGYLETLDSRKMKIPAPSVIERDNVYYIEPEKNVSFAIWLKMKREKLGFTQTQIAEKLGMKYQAYQRIEDPEKSNPRLKTIIKIEKVFGEELIRV